MTREESKSATRRELLRAAGRLFLRDGFVATSLANIADEVGVTKGAVYSNFESKEDLFLALLQEPVSPTEIYSPSITDAGFAGQMSTGLDAAREFGRYSAGMRPSRRHVALFLESNAAALRSDRARDWVAGNTRDFAIRLGTGLADAFEAPRADPLALGLIAQSLYVGLLTHGAFLDEIDADMFAAAYETLVSAARTLSAAATDS